MFDSISNDLGKRSGLPIFVSRTHPSEVAMRLILMGTGPFAVPSFQALLQRGYEILHVVTRPTVPLASKKEPPQSPIRQWATNNSLPIAAPASINNPETILWLTSLRADLMVVCDYGQILSRDGITGEDRPLDGGCAAMAREQ